MRVFPYVTVIGDTTGGGSGSPIGRELPNGWTYRISRSMAMTPEKCTYEGVGLVPDITIQNTEADSTAGIDTILESAIKFLNSEFVNSF